MKTVISFDGDGTLWYPKSTRHKIAPHRIYKGFPSVEEANKNLVLIPGIIEILSYCKTKGITLILLSTNPNILSVAQKQVEERAKLLGVNQYFNFIISARDYLESKGEILTDFAKNNNLNINNLLHIGDSYNRDYKSTQDKGIDSLLIKSEYMKETLPYAVKYKDLLNEIKKVVE